MAEKAAELQPKASSSHRWQVCIAVARGDGETALRQAWLGHADALTAVAPFGVPAEHITDSLEAISAGWRSELRGAHA